jgi:hypothetical protein
VSEEKKNPEENNQLPGGITAQAAQACITFLKTKGESCKAAIKMLETALYNRKVKRLEDAIANQKKYIAELEKMEIDGMCMEGSSQEAMQDDIKYNQELLVKLEASLKKLKENKE